MSLSADQFLSVISVKFYKYKVLRSGLFDFCERFQIYVFFENGSKKLLIDDIETESEARSIVADLFNSSLEAKALTESGQLEGGAS